MAQAWRWLGAFSMLVACGGASGAPASSGAVSHAPRVAAVPALEDARRLRDEAEAMTAPPTPPISDRDESLAYLRGPLKEWIVRRRAAVDRAAAAYAEAFPRLNEAESAVAALELGELWRSFASTFVERGVSAVSPDIKSATLFGAYRAAIEDAAAPQLEQARLAYEKCASQAAAESKRTAARCRERLSKLTRRVEPAPAKRAAPSAGGHVIEPKRAWLTTRQPAPCTFAGSLRLPGAPISLEPNGEPFARLTLLELSQLELPPRRGEPLRLTSAWPIRATFYLGAEQLPFMPRNRIELVPKQVWLGGYAAVAAAEPHGDSALAYRLASATPDPARVVPCAELELNSDVNPEIAPEVQPFAGEIHLNATPGGKEVASFTLAEPHLFGIIEQRGPWRHVAAREPRTGGPELPYHFSAWTKQHPTTQQNFGMIGLLEQNASPTHVVTRELDVFTAPRAAAKLGVLVKDVAVLLGETRDGFVNVELPGLMRSGDDWGFWVKAEAFQASARQL